MGTSAREVSLGSLAVYWWTIGSARLSPNTRSLIEGKSNPVLVSGVSFYELDYKTRLKKLDLKQRELRAAITSSGFQTLAISDLHADLRRPSTGAPGPMRPDPRSANTARALRTDFEQRGVRCRATG